VIKKPRTRGGYSPARGLQNTNTQLVVAPGEKKLWPYFMTLTLNSAGVKLLIHDNHRLVSLFIGKKN
jgi:hypothetical protein